MPIDSSGIESQIDSNLPDNTSRQNGASVVRFVLKTVVRWVRDAVNGNLSTWLRTSDNQPGGSNTDNVYRTGNTEFRGGITARSTTPNNTPLGSIPFGNQYPLQIQGLNGGPAFMEFHLPGFLIQQVGIDTDGVLKMHAWNTTKAYPVVIDTITARVKLAQTTGRKLVLYEINDNENQYYGLGVDAAGLLTYIVPETLNDHAFYAATSAATRKELMRIRGNGSVGIGRSNSTRPLEVGATNPADGILAELINLQGGGTGTGGFIRLSQTDAGFWDLGVTKDNVFVIRGWNGAGALLERARFVPAGRMLIGQTTDTGVDLLQVGGSISGKFNTASANPGSGDIPAGYFRLQKNTSNGEVRLWVNDGGTMKSTLLS